jgi:FAD/FMN-containing dehydrogenase
MRGFVSSRESNIRRGLANLADRRHFLKCSLGASAAAFLKSSGSGTGGEAPHAQAPAPVPNHEPSAGAWDALAAQIQGQLIRPGHVDYERLRRSANARWDVMRPQALLRCAGAADIQAGLSFARSLKVEVVPRSGGHSYLGNSTGGGLVIDVSAMNGVRLDGDLAVVGAGAKLWDVYKALISQGRCIPSGSCGSVGISGITLGGGFGVVDRAYGLTCDVLRSARLITADGTELFCDATRNPELFWALRGGGGGNFGIVTEFTFQTHAVTPLQQFSASFTLADLHNVLTAWSQWPLGLPDHIWSQLRVSANGCFLKGVSIGDRADLLPHWQGLLSRIDRRPLNTRIQSCSYRELMLEPSQSADGPLNRIAMAASSDFFDRLNDPQGMALALSAALAGRRNPGLVTLNLMGGAIGRIAVDATAFPHRSALFSAQYIAKYDPLASSAQINEGEQWAHGMRDVLRAWSSGRAYQNYPDALITDPEQAYYGGNLARLKQIKALFDPTALFNQPQGISASGKRRSSSSNGADTTTHVGHTPLSDIDRQHP